MQFVLIFLGSGLGGVARYALSAAVQARTTDAFPTGTFVVNILGCFAIGLLGTIFAAMPAAGIRDEYRVALVVGVLGGFTTFSAFGSETFALAADRHLLLAALNIVLSLALGLIAVWLGAWLGGALSRS